MPVVRVDEQIFENYPTFVRGIVIARNVENGGQSRELEAMLGQAVEEVSRNPVDVKTDPRTAVWLDAHRRFGSNPNKFPPAHCALLKRVRKPGTRIPFINKVVSTMNYNSIVDAIPVGGDDLEQAGNCLELRYAQGNETFTPLGQPEVLEHSETGEVIYVIADTGDVMCRRWNWRNGHNTRITEDTKIVVMNIDGLGEDSEARAITTRDRVAKMFEDFCGAEVLTTLLTPFRNSYEIEP
ncbi:MAG: hypothetical protein JRJ03_08375 [Deltaproteobacteria bacterium]|nr:hypothetical protein [Deltaproteobacteria bacterium]